LALENFKYALENSRRTTEIARFSSA